MDLHIHLKQESIPSAFEERAEITLRLKFDIDIS